MNEAKVFLDIGFGYFSMHFRLACLLVRLSAS